MSHISALFHELQRAQVANLIRSHQYTSHEIRIEFHTDTRHTQKQDIRAYLTKQYRVSTDLTDNYNTLRVWGFTLGSYSPSVK